MKKIRADQALFENMALQSIELAKALIMEGRVMTGDRKIISPCEMLMPDTPFRIRGQLDAYVSRGAYKLKKALDVFGIDLRDRVCMDVGSSTGGFTDVMLRAGAKKVYAVDVGYNLLDYRLRSNPKVECMERTNARYLDICNFDPRPSFGATDVSFISLKVILPSVLNVIQREGARFVALVKPQFEADKKDVGEKGVVRDKYVHKNVLKTIIDYIPVLGWQVCALDYSPIRGPEGNIEFLMEMLPSDEVTDFNLDYAIDVTICQAYDKFFKSSEEDL